MDYLSALRLAKEPFSNSPDPDFFCPTLPHQDCLFKLEVALRLRRGLNAVIGDVGSGKTTVCRRLVRRLAADKSTETHLLLDPSFGSAKRFLRAVAELLAVELPGDAEDWAIKEAIKAALFRKGIKEGRNLVLLVDEAQKLPADCLESLREFLNYETNRFKLLQIVLFGQPELEQKLLTQPNLADRLNLFYELKPLSFRETCRLVRFRLAMASNRKRTPKLFTLPALWRIHRAAEGYPRQIVTLCHKCLLAMLVLRKKRVSCFLAGGAVRRGDRAPAPAWHRAVTTALILAPALAIAITLGLAVARSPSPEPTKLRAEIPKASVHRAKIIHPNRGDVH